MVWVWIRLLMGLGPFNRDGPSKASTSKNGSSSKAGLRKSILRDGQF
jgi:hypothetical protein